VAYSAGSVGHAERRDAAPQTHRGGAGGVGDEGGRPTDGEVREAHGRAV